MSKLFLGVLINKITEFLKIYLWILSVVGMKKKNYQQIENRKLANPPSSSNHSNQSAMFHFYFK